jgi:small conductance mechanosensitive channel
VPNDGDVSDRVITAAITAAVGLVLLVLARWALKHALARYLIRAGERRPADEVAVLRTRAAVLQRVIVAFLAAIVVWSVLSIFPTTDRLATTLLASGAVLALFFGLAFTTPLSNLGAGILLAFTQPVRLGDRVTIGEAAGEVEQINLIHTVLLTDDDRRIFIPNVQLMSSTVVNRTVKDPRRLVSVRLPVDLAAPLDRARAVVIEAARGVEPTEDVSVAVADVGDKLAWLAVTAYAPAGTNVVQLASELRERGLAALAREELLPV